MHIIHVHNDLNTAQTVNGTFVHRENKVWFPEEGRERFVMCAPYDNHFTFVDEHNIGWALFCTCGSPAGVVGYQVYKTDASPSSEGSIPGEMLVCLHHAQYQRHLDGSS